MAPPIHDISVPFLKTMCKSGRSLEETPTILVPAQGWSGRLNIKNAVQYPPCMS